MIRRTLLYTIYVLDREYQNIAVLEVRAAFVALDATAFDFSAFFLHEAFYNNMCVGFV